MARRGRPPRNREQERLLAEAAIMEWRRAHRIDLSFAQGTSKQAMFPRLVAEIQWLRLRLGETEDTVDTLDAIVKTSPPPTGNSLT